MEYLIPVFLFFFGGGGRGGRLFRVQDFRVRIFRVQDFRVHGFHPYFEGFRSWNVSENIRDIQIFWRDKLGVRSPIFLYPNMYFRLVLRPER